LFEETFIPDVLSTVTVFISNQGFPNPIHLNTIVHMRCLYCSTVPLTAERIPGLGFASDHHAQVLVASKGLLCGGTEHVVYTWGGCLNELKSLVGVDSMLGKGFRGYR
jgi:hypothetical protein